MTVRNVVLGRLAEGADPARLDAALAALHHVRTPGMISMNTGRDLGLRAGGWDMAITCDFTDAAAYRAYDEDTEHERIRREMFAPVCSEIARAQIDLA